MKIDKSLYCSIEIDEYNGPLKTLDNNTHISRTLKGGSVWTRKDEILQKALSIYRDHEHNGLGRSRSDWIIERKNSKKEKVASEEKTRDKLRHSWYAETLLGGSTASGMIDVACSIQMIDLVPATFSRVATVAAVRHLADQSGVAVNVILDCLEAPVGELDPVH